MGKPNDPSTAGGNKRKDNRKTFSVSKGFSDIHDILDSLPDNESSRFICESIRFYHQYKNNPNWMGEQLQSIIAMTNQLQHAMSGLGNVGYSPTAPFPQNGSIPMHPTQMPNPNAMGHVQPHQQANIEPQRESVQPSSPLVDEVAVATQSISEEPHINNDLSLPINHTESKTKEVLPNGEDNMAAVESEDRYRSSQSNPPSGNVVSKQEQEQKPPTRQRKRGGMASSLASKSMGVKQDD